MDVLKKVWHWGHFRFQTSRRGMLSAYSFSNVCLLHCVLCRQRLFVLFTTVSLASAPAGHSVLSSYLFEEFKWRQVGWVQQKLSFRLTATPPISILHEFPTWITRTAAVWPFWVSSVRWQVPCTRRAAFLGHSFAVCSSLPCPHTGSLQLASSRVLISSAPARSSTDHSRSVSTLAWNLWDIDRDLRG